MLFSSQKVNTWGWKKRLISKENTTESSDCIERILNVINTVCRMHTYIRTYIHRDRQTYIYYIRTYRYVHTVHRYIMIHSRSDLIVLIVTALYSNRILQFSMSASVGGSHHGRPKLDGEGARRKPRKPRKGPKNPRHADPEIPRPRMAPKKRNGRPSAST